ncbi:hypothetical protein K8O92_28060 [Nocardia asteroides]|nr:hypothetical protein K8O92_28060 [Nocardia asteroides]
MLVHVRSAAPGRQAPGAVVPVAFGADVHRALLDRACAARASLFMVLQTAFAVAVGAFSDSADVTTLFAQDTAVAFVELFTATVELLATGYRGPIAPLLSGFPAGQR